jgi:hypothetical protein
LRRWIYFIATSSQVREIGGSRQILKLRFVQVRDALAPFEKKLRADQ